MTTTNCIKYRKGYKYQLAENLEIHIPIFPKQDIEAEYIKLSREGKLFIQNGYAWDGPSGPTVDSLSSLRGSLIHDALYQLIREGFLSMDCRKDADKILCDYCISDGMWRLRAKIWKWAVRIFAKSSAEWESEHQILTAPDRRA